MKAKDIKVGEHYLLEMWAGYERKLLVDKVEKTERHVSRRIGGSSGGDIRVFGRFVDPDTGAVSQAGSGSYPLSKIIAPWNEERYVRLKQACEDQKAADIEDAEVATLLIEALAKKGCCSEYQRDRGVMIPRSSMRALLSLIRQA